MSGSPFFRLFSAFCSPIGSHSVSQWICGQDWLRQKLQVRPMLAGVKPYWQKSTGLLPAAVSQSLVLEDLLKRKLLARHRH